MSARALKTWGDIKLATLQKLFSSNGTQITADSSTAEYIYAMPQTCMEALQMLATVGKFIVKEYEINNERFDNLLSNGFTKYRLYDETLSLKADSVGSFYFDALGGFTVEVYFDGVLDRTLTLSSDQYEGVSGTFASQGSVELRFIAPDDHPVCVKNICMYHERFPSDDSVPPYGEFLYYYLPDIVEDFYQLKEDDIYYVNPSNEPSYIAANNLYQEANNTLVLRRDQPGTYRIYYKAYPQQIDLTTPDDYELPLDPEVAVLLPLYMASQLYKDDDNAISTVYRNEFEVAFERLSNGANTPRKESFESVTGWV